MHIHALLANWLLMDIMCPKSTLDNGPSDILAKKAYLCIKVKYFKILSDISVCSSQTNYMLCDTHINIHT